MLKFYYKGKLYKSFKSTGCSECIFVGTDCTHFMSCVRNKYGRNCNPWYEDKLKKEKIERILK